MKEKNTHKKQGTTAANAGAIQPQSQCKEAWQAGREEKGGGVGVGGGSATRVAEAHE